MEKQNNHTPREYSRYTLVIQGRPVTAHFPTDTDADENVASLVRDMLIASYVKNIGKSA